MSTNTGGYSPTAGVFATRSGKTHTHVNTLSDADREAFLSFYDPIRRLGLTGDSAFFRSTEPWRVEGGRIAGNEETCARIENHQAIETRRNPFVPVDACDDELQQFEEAGIWIRKTIPVEMKAHELTDHSKPDRPPLPSLNVAFGPGGLDLARGYQKEGDVIVKMYLRDFLAAGGGLAFDDVSSAAAQDEHARALVITLPKGKTIPVEVVKAP
jgi:hypothetical protein